MSDKATILLNTLKKIGNCFNMKLNFEDLVPQRATFKLSTIESKIVLKPWSLKIRFWALKKYGQARLQEIMQNQSLEELCEIAFYMMDEESKVLFKDFDHFTESIQKTEDILAVSMALLNTIGISEPAIEEMRKELKAREVPKAPAPVQKKKSKPTGA
ncbi:MAG: hypothetical protein ACK5YR_16545 [Pirellula sp.]